MLITSSILMLSVCGVGSSSAFAADGGVDTREIQQAVEEAGSVEAYLRMSATQTGKILPKMIDPVTEITGSYSEGRTLGLNERITDANTNRVLFSVDKATLRSRFEANALPNVCNVAINRYMMQTYDVTYAFAIHSMDGHLILTYVANRETCRRWQTFSNLDAFKR